MNPDPQDIPDPPESAALMPLPRADRRALVDPADWVRAQADHAAGLAEAAMAVGALQDRLARAPAGWRHRLAVMEVTEQSWHLDARLPADQLALYLAQRLTRATQDAQALARAAWGVRRLLGALSVAPADLARFLGRDTPAAQAQAALMQRPVGQEFQALADDWGRYLDGADALHPICRACLGWHLWQMMELSGSDARIEGAIVAARIGAGQGRRAAPFLPVALSGGEGYRGGGNASERLARWINAVQGASLAGLMECDRIAAWAARAQAGTADLSGRTPGQLIAGFADWPMVSAPMLEDLTGVSRPSVQRNLTLLQSRGLIREVTGQARFRFWTAAL